MDNFCTNCGTRIPAGSDRCPNCGKPAGQPNGGAGGYRGNGGNGGSAGNGGRQRGGMGMIIVIALIVVTVLAAAAILLTSDLFKNRKTASTGGGGHSGAASATAPDAIDFTMPAFSDDSGGSGKETEAPDDDEAETPDTRETEGSEGGGQAPPKADDGITARVNYINSRAEELFDKCNDSSEVEYESCDYGYCYLGKREDFAVVVMPADGSYALDRYICFDKTETLYAYYVDTENKDTSYSFYFQDDELIRITYTEDGGTPEVYDDPDTWGKWPGYVYEHVGRAWEMTQMDFSADSGVRDDEPEEDDDDYDSSDDYIFPQSDKEYLTDSDLYGYDKETLQHAINEIYARRGYIFTKNMDEKAYFESKPWYRGVSTDMAYIESLFNKYEKANVNKIRDYQKTH